MPLAGRGAVVAVLVSVQVMFALHYLAAKVVLGVIAPAAWAYLRIFSAAVVFLIIYLLSGGPRVDRADLGRLALFSLFGVLINQICFIEGLARTTPSHASLILTTIPVATLLFAVLLGREKLRVSSVLGIFSALAGVLILLRIDDLDLRAEWFLGDVLVWINGTSFALFLVLSKRVVERLGPATSSAGILCFGSLGAALYGGPAALELEPARIAPEIWLLAVLIVIFPTILAYYLNYWALARVQSSHVALFIYLQPILASTLSVILLGDVVTWRLVLSSVFVFLGVLIASLGGAAAGRRRPAPSAEPARQNS